MSRSVKNVLLFAVMGVLLILVGTMQSWNVALAILNMCLISAVMALGVNIQWGYAGLFNAGVMGFTALGGLAAIVVSVAPVPAAWDAGGARAILGLLAGLATIAGTKNARSSKPPASAKDVILRTFAARRTRYSMNA